jgi:hypothetical protein
MFWRIRTLINKEKLPFVPYFYEMQRNHLLKRSIELQTTYCCLPVLDNQANYPKKKINQAFKTIQITCVSLQLNPLVLCNKLVAYLTHYSFQLQLFQLHPSILSSLPNFQCLNLLCPC